MENKRSTRLLLGLVLAFSLLLAGLEYTSSPTDSDMDSEMFEDLVQDMEVVPNDRKDMISAVSAPASHAVTARVKPVEAAVSSPEKLNPNTGTQPVGDGGGAVDATKVTEALPQTAADDEKAKDFRIVQQLPEFPGGWVEFMKWLTKNLKYPSQAQSQRIQGQVVVTFIVNKDGSVADIRIPHPTTPVLDSEVLRVMRMMPKWKPGVDNDKPCRTMMAIPVVFNL